MARPAVGVDGATPVTISATSSAQDLVDTINRDIGGVTASLNSDGGLVLSNDTGKSITVAGGAQVGLVDDTYQGYVSLTSADGKPVDKLRDWVTWQNEKPEDGLPTLEKMISQL